MLGELSMDLYSSIKAAENEVTRTQIDKGTRQEAMQILSHIIVRFWKFRLFDHFLKFWWCFFDTGLAVSKILYVLLPLH